MTKKYKIEAPLGNIVVPNKLLSETELREFVIQIISGTDELNKSETKETWEEKAKKDDIMSVVDWLITAGYKVKEINE